MAEYKTPVGPSPAHIGDSTAAKAKATTSGMLRAKRGENCFQAVTQDKPFPAQAGTRVVQPDRGEWINWLWAWQNPHPEKEIASLRFELSAVSAGKAS